MSYPPPGGIAAPEYGRPPKKNRAGLFVVAMLLLLVAVLGTGVWVATKVVSSVKPKSPAPVTSAPKPTVPVKPKPTVPLKPTAPVKTVPVKPVPVTPPVAGRAAQVVAQFVARLNANDTKGATALGCADTKQAIPVQMRQFVRRPASLTVNKAPVNTAGPIMVFSLGGTMQGSAASGILVIEVASRPCVKSFVAH
ncbi:hypothetical protein ACI2LF_04175 [Kribbella sp. NPDC020789]